MADFYTKKVAVLDKLENTIKRITKEYLDVSEERLISDIGRLTGFSLILRKHIEQLVSDGRVKRENKNGKTFIYWDFDKEKQEMLANLSSLQ